MTWKQILGIQVKKDKKKYLNPFEVSVKSKFPHKGINLPLFITYTIMPIRYLTNKKGVFHYHFKVEFFDSLASEKKEVIVRINAKKFEPAKQWIHSKLKDHTILNFNGKIINLL